MRSDNRVGGVEESLAGKRIRVRDVFDLERFAVEEGERTQLGF